MSRILFILLITLYAAAGYSQIREATILQVEKNRFKAMINKDSAFLARFLASDLIYVHADGVHDSKETLMNNILSGNLEYYSIELLQADIRMHNQTAWIQGAAKIKVRNGRNAQPTDLSISYLDIYRRDEGDWKLAAWQSTRLN